MTPTQLLIILLVTTALALIVQRAANRHRTRQLRAIAKQYSLTYCPTDRFGLAAKVAQSLPLVGAADVHISDLIYGRQGNLCRYIFTAQYTLGIIGTKRRQSRVAMFLEPWNDTTPPPSSPTTLAPSTSPLLDQYHHLAQSPQEQTVDSRQ